ncbi:tetratricopeptide repeat protein [Nisaea nitritireducens]|uniref:tetratricopeptide repeat protein n=1 Tax=Nisaea nitritireducens TaxID=568392 RepID=UPI001868CC62|nr:tetratricopeptide repeat protein [Nisaea nitritireducens]
MTDQPASLQALLQQAVSEHGAGRFAKAEPLYREVLSRAPKHPVALYLLGVLALQVGRPETAVELISNSLVEQPDNAEAHYNLGNACLALGRASDAEREFREAIRCQPDYAAAHYNLGNLEKDAGQLEAAERSFRAAARYAPDLAQAWCNLGLVLVELDRKEEAVAAYRTGLSKAPELAEGHNNLGNALAGLERYDEAVASYREALSANAVFGAAYRNLGTALQKRGDEKDAARAFRQALLLDPAIAENCVNFATIQRMSKAYEFASRWSRFALSIRPDYPAALMACGLVQLALKEFEVAIDSFGAVVQADPRNAAGWGNLGICRQELGDMDAARDAYRRALCLEPAATASIANSVLVSQSFLDFDRALLLARRGLVVEPLSAALLTVRADALRASGRLVDAEYWKRAVICVAPGDTAFYVNLNIVRRAQSRLHDAERDLRRGLIISPGHTKALMQLGELFAELGRLDEAVVLGRKAVRGAPDNVMVHNSLLFYLHYKPKLSTAEMMRDYRFFDDAIGRPLRNRWRPHSNRRDPRKRLRIGYVGAGFHWHSSASFFMPLMKNHDHARYEIFCYASYPRGEDCITQEMRSNADHWISTMGMSNDALVKRIRDDGIDILVDLAGHTKGNRLRVFAEKPAPVSFHWLDHGVTTGLSAIDYFLGDPVFTPEDSADLFTEKIWNLPKSVFPFEPIGWTQTETPPPAELNGYVTFGSVARAVKLSDDVFKVWAEILHQTPGTRFSLFNHACREPSVRQDMIDRFGRLGIGSERLSIGFCTQSQEAYAQIDIMLDTFPHNNGVTGFEGIYMGLPTVTLRGKAAIGTLGSSMLTQIGRAEWIAETVEDYVRIACEIASDPLALPELRSSLRRDLLSSPVMDGASFARDFEAACRDMWVKWCSEGEVVHQGEG